MAMIRPLDFRLDQAKRRFTPTFNSVPGIGIIEKWLLGFDWKQKPLATPPANSELKPIFTDFGVPILGHSIELVRKGPEFVRHMYQIRGPVFFLASPILASIVAVGPDAAEAIYANRNKDFSQEAWNDLLDPFFKRGLITLGFDEHLLHRRIMQEAFSRSSLCGYVSQIDAVVSRAVEADWVPDDPRFLFYPAMARLTFDIASNVFMGHHSASDSELVMKMCQAFNSAVAAGGALIRVGLPPFKWWRGLRARKVLESYLTERIVNRRDAQGNDLLAVLCRAEDQQGNRFTDEEIVDHMIFLMMAAMHTTTSMASAVTYYLAAHQEWQERVREESDKLGDRPLELEAAETLKVLDLVMSESIRLAAPAQFVMRRAVRDTELLGYYVPAGANVMVWPWVNHRLPDIWTDPETFDPDRFSEPRAEHKRHRFAFAPFGAGAHKCIGMTFAQLAVKSVIHRMVREYRLELIRADYEPRYDYTRIPAPIDGLPIVLRPRRPYNMAGSRDGCEMRS